MSAFFIGFVSGFFRGITYPFVVIGFVYEMCKFSFYTGIEHADYVIEKIHRYDSE